MEPASSIIKKLGGEAEVAKVTGTASTAPYRWQYSRDKGGTDGRIPQNHIGPLLALAREKGVDLTITDFFPSEDDHAPEPERVVAS